MLRSVVNTQVPDSIEPIIGWRTWALTRSYGAWALSSPDLGQLWPPGGDIYATCKATHETQAQRESCNCGINAFKTPEHLADSKYKRRDVIGEVELWGEVTEYDDGWRGQWARPKRLILQLDFSDEALQVAQELSERYGVEVALSNLHDIADEAKIEALKTAKDEGKPLNPPSNVVALGVVGPATASPAPASRARKRINAALAYTSLLALFVCAFAIAFKLELAVTADNTAQLLEGKAHVADEGSDDGKQALVAFGTFMAYLFIAIGWSWTMILGFKRKRIFGKNVGEVAFLTTIAVLLPTVIAALFMAEDQYLSDSAVQALTLSPSKDVSLAVDGKYSESLANLVGDLGLQIGECRKHNMDIDEVDLLVNVCRESDAITFSAKDD